MGIVVVLIFYAVALSILATVSAAIHGVIVSRVLKPGHSKRKRALVATTVFPFVCVAYAGCWFAAYAVINDRVFHRDPGLGDSWQTPLPNGYALLMIDVTDHGTVYNPKTQSGAGVSSNDTDTEFGVRQLQISNQFIIGALDSEAFNHLGEKVGTVDTWFVLDTANKSKIEFKSRSELDRFATSHGMAVRLRPFESVFGEYHNTWFDAVAAAVLLLPPLAAYALLIYWVWKLRKKDPATPMPEQDAGMLSRQGKSFWA